LELNPYFVAAAVLDSYHGLSFQGFDEFMNIVMDEATEVYVKDAKPRRELGTDPLNICEAFMKADDDPCQVASC